MRKRKKRVCQTCRGSGVRTRFISLYKQVPESCLTCGGSGFIENK